jgi:hypothetical protein
MNMITLTHRQVTTVGALAVCLTGVTFLSPTHGAQEVSPPGGLVLLPGYRHAAGRGIDTHVGRIWKENGPVISYDIGPGASSIAKPRMGDNTLWVKEISIDEKTVLRVNMQKDQTTVLIDIGAWSCFAAHNIGAKEDLAEVLMMLMSYTPPPWRH